MTSLHTPEVEIIWALGSPFHILSLVTGHCRSSVNVEHKLE